MQKAGGEQAEPLAAFEYEVAALGSEQQQHTGVDVAERRAVGITQGAGQIQGDVDGQDQERGKAVLRNEAAEQLSSLSTPARDRLQRSFNLKLAVRTDAIRRRQ